MTKVRTFGLPFTPSKFVSKDVILAKEIHISCGGGMGGSSWEEYTIDEFDLNNRFIEVRTNRSGLARCSINTSFIVSVKDVRLVRMKIKNLGNHNRGEVNETEEYCYVIPDDGSKVVFENEYDNRDCRDSTVRGTFTFLDKE